MRNAKLTFLSRDTHAFPALVVDEVGHTTGLGADELRASIELLSAKFRQPRSQSDGILLIRGKPHQTVSHTLHSYRQLRAAAVPIQADVVIVDAGPDHCCKLSVTRGTSIPNLHA